jgi:hypothetical protein
MSRKSVACVLLVLCLLAAAPLQAKPSPVAANGTPAVSFEFFLAGLWERAARLLNGVREKEGVTIDPDGATNPTPTPSPIPEGASIDPDGRP